MSESFIPRLNLLHNEDVFFWSKKILGVYGLWPENPSDLRLSLYLMYVMSFDLMDILTLYQNIHDLEKFCRVMTKVFPNILLLLKVFMFRLQIRSVLALITIVNEDTKKGLYETDGEKETFVTYSSAAALFTSSCYASLFMASALFFVLPIIDCTLNGFDNCSLPFELTKRVPPIFEVTESSTYFYICLYFVSVIPLLPLGATGADSVLVSVTFHICTQLSILASRIKDASVDQREYDLQMRSLVRRHIELLRFASALENVSSPIMFVQTFGLMWSLCIVVFQLLMMTDGGDLLNTVTYVIFSTAVVILIFCYCFIGECLIHESSKVEVAYYRLNWYELPARISRPLTVCIARSQRPLYLTAGKFYVLSIETFATILKSSMAYLSVLRNVA